MYDDALPAGSIVGEFEIRRVLGYGGFGIVYEAYEAMLDRRVALKEYFLRGYSRRDGLQVRPSNDDAAEMFNSGAARFVREARLLSMLNERTRSDGSLVAVYRVFQANGTAFMAMKLYEGQTMRNAVHLDPDMVTEPWLIRLMERLLDALHGLHSLPGENLVHRDVSPDNIILQPDGSPVLLDFGATRKANDAQTSLIFKPGYSPIEQYTDSFPLGPWTDLYALCGVAYFAVTGQSPLPAIDRYAGAIFKTASALGDGRFSKGFLALIDRGMAVQPENRFRSCDELRAALEQVKAGTYDVPPPPQPVPPRLYDDQTTQVMSGRDAPTVAWQSPEASAPVSVPPSTPASAPPSTPLSTPLSTPVSTPVSAPVSAPIPAPATRPHTAPPAPVEAGASMPMAATPSSRRPLLLMLGGGLVIAALAGYGWQKLRPRPPASTVSSSSNPTVLGQVAPALPADPVASSAATGTAATASSPTGATTASVAPARVPGLACTAEAADWPCVLDGLAKLSTAQELQLKVAPTRMKVGQPITLELAPKSDGRLMILGVNDVPGGKLVLVFPNDADANDRAHAGQPMQLPRRQFWDLVAQPPLGRSYMIAVLTPQPLAAPAGLRQGVSLQQAVQAFASGRPLSLLGVADCTSAGPAKAAECPKSLSLRAADFIIE